MPNPLSLAIKANDSKTFSALLNAPDFSTYLNAPGEPDDGLIEEEVVGIPLHLAVYLGHKEMVASLLRKGAKLENPDYEDDVLELVLRNLSTPEIVANKCSIIESLCSAGVTITAALMEDVIFRCRESWISGQQASYQSIQAIAKTLHQHVIFPEFISYVRAGDVKTVKEYLEVNHSLMDEISGREFSSFRINPNQDIGYGKAMLIAATLKTPDMLKLLSKYKGDLTITDEQGRNLIHCAARYGRTDNIKWIVNKLTLPGAEVANFLNGRDHAGNTPLHYSARYEEFSATDTLLSFGADPTLRNARNQSASQMSDDRAIGVLFNKMYKKNQPSLVWLSASKLAAHSHEPGVAEAIQRLPEDIRSLVFLSNYGQPPKAAVVPSKIEEVASEEGDKGVKADGKKKKGV